MERTIAFALSVHYLGLKDCSANRLYRPVLFICQAGFIETTPIVDELDSRDHMLIPSANNFVTSAAMKKNIFGQLENICHRKCRRTQKWPMQNKQSH